MRVRTNYVFDSWKNLLKPFELIFPVSLNFLDRLFNLRSGALYVDFLDQGENNLTVDVAILFIVDRFYVEFLLLGNSIVFQVNLYLLTPLWQPIYAFIDNIVDLNKNIPGIYHFLLDFFRQSMRLYQQTIFMDTSAFTLWITAHKCIFSACRARTDEQRLFFFNTT